MIVSREGSGVTVWAPAKLNLFLEVLAKRADGFHELETLMCPISLFDTLYFDFAPRTDLALACEHAREAWLRKPQRVSDLPEGIDNIVVRALALLCRHAGVDRGAAVRLVKRIPIAAGLAGGSSDAAAALVAGNIGWNLGLDDATLARLGAQLGSDVPFFLARGAAVCRGRGEQVQPIPGLGSWWFVVVFPDEGLSTAAVFQACRPTSTPRSVTGLLTALGARRESAIRGALHNQLQPAAEKLSETIGRLRTEFQQHDMIAHQMSGSGSSYFGLCRHARQAHRLAARLRHRGVGQVFVTRSCA